MSEKPLLRHLSGGWEATHSCGWIYFSGSLPRTYTEAAYHTCRPRLGPRPYSPDTTITACEGSTTVYAEDPSTEWHSAAHRLEVWL